MINADNGILIAKGDEDSLVKELGNMLDNLNKYDRENIRDEAISKYSYPVIGKQFAEIYSEIIQQNGAQ